MKLAIRIIAAAFFTTLTMFVTAAYFRIRTTYDDFEMQQRAVASQLAEAMVDPLREVWHAEGKDGVDRFIQRENSQNRMGPRLRWVWFDPDAPEANHPRLPMHRWPDADDDEPKTIITANPIGERLLLTYVRVDLVSEQSGGLELTERLAPLDQLTWRRLQIDLAALAALAATSIGVAYWSGMVWIRRPLQGLLAKTDQIAKGDFASPLPIVPHNELGDLGRAIQRMAGQLEQQRAAIQAETEQRISALEQVRHADRLSTVGRLAAGIAHELGTPLNVIGGRAALIASGQLNTADAQSSAAVIKTEADRITAIIRNLMDFARQRRPSRTLTNLHLLTVQSASLLQEIASRKNIRIEVAPSADLCPALVDVSQIQQVLINLMTNAIDAIAADGTVWVEVGGDPPARAESQGAPNFVRLSVRDNGTGIADNHLPHIFEPFFTTKDVGQGTGLGLSIAYGIIQEHGGRIEVASKQGQGTCFTIYLPSEI